MGRRLIGGRALLAAAGLVFAGAGGSAGDAGSTVTVAAPDGAVQVAFRLAHVRSQQGVPSYDVTFRGKPLIRDARLGIDLIPSGPLRSNLRLVSVERAEEDHTYSIFPGKSSTARDHYAEATLHLEETIEPHRKLDLLFRAYNDGVAFRYAFPGQPALRGLTVSAEETRFAVTGNPKAYQLPVSTYTTPYEFYYRVQSLREADSLLGLPLLLEYPDRTALAITEADLTEYAGMYLAPDPDAPGTLVSRLSPNLQNPRIKVRAPLPHRTPWRVLMIASEPGKLIESNLVMNLSPPSEIADTSWIKPGKTTFPWWNGFHVPTDAGFPGGLNTATEKHYIDFCAERGIPYHSLDGLDNIAWYGGTIVPYTGADITRSLPEIDLPEVIRYAKEKGVKLRLWLHSAAVRAHMRTAFPAYERWGIEGIMVDFVERDDQETVRWVREMVALAAKHHLTVTLHNISKPTGLRRTYPNLLTTEAVLNLEFDKWDPKGSTPEHELILPFTRMLAGPLDYHSGSFRNVTEAEFRPRNVAPSTIGTRARQLARYVVYEGYLPMVADSPATYRADPAGLELLAQLPVTWDETRFLSGDVGEYVVLARRSGRTWYLGMMTNSAPRRLEVPLSFLGGGGYTAEVFGDPAQPGAPTALETRRLTVTRKSTLRAHLAAAGGQVARFTPLSR